MVVCGTVSHELSYPVQKSFNNASTAYITKVSFAIATPTYWAGWCSNANSEVLFLSSRVSTVASLLCGVCHTASLSGVTGLKLPVVQHATSVNRVHA